MARDSIPYRLLRGAREDLRRGALWYEERREGLGQAFAADVRSAVRMIAAAPLRWPVRRGSHRYVMRRFPYTIAYRVIAGEVLVLAVAHQRLDPSDWEDR